MEKLIFGKKIVTSLGKVSVFLIIFLFFYLLGYSLKKIIRQKLRLRLIQKEIITFVSDLVFYSSVVLGVIIGLSNIGINTNALLASLGLGGFAVGLALKDIIANFVSGLLIILSKTFKVGDELKIGPVEGIIKSINLRHTILTDKKKPDVRILVPNSNIFSSIISIKKQNLNS